MTGDATSRMRRALPLVVGIVALEFAAAVSRFVASTLLPVVSADLQARDQLALLVAGETLGLFVALPLAERVVRILGARGTFGGGVLTYVGGLVAAATAGYAWVFAAGQLVAGVASGLLAVFGVGAAISHLDDSVRVRLVAASSAMWILPALVGPPATLGLQHLIGWRWTLLTPIPIVLLGRLLIVRATREDTLASGTQRPIGRTLLVPVGAAALAFADHGWPLAVAGTVITLLGATAIMPLGTARLARGTPAALAAMTLFAFGYFGADSLVTILLTDAYHATLGQAAIVLSAAPLAWGITGLLAPRLLRGTRTGRLPVVGLAVATVGVLTVAVGMLVPPVFAVPLTGWTLTGVGIGLMYPGLYVLSTTPAHSGLDATGLAVAVITAEELGGLLGRVGGGRLSSLPGPAGLTVTYFLFAAALALAACAAGRSPRRGEVS